MKSIVTDYKEICAICGKPSEADHHLVFGNGLRRLSEADGLKIPICNKCHNMGIACSKIHDNSMAEALSKIVGQLAWEKEFYKNNTRAFIDEDPARDAFRKRYGRSYL